MPTTPRLLAIMGSGETAPTMIKPHRELFDMLGLDSPSAVLLDTPVGFQENAEEISEKAITYFADSIGRAVELATFKSAETASTIEVEQMRSAAREADWLFTGPGSPSYALRQWRAVGFESVVAERLTRPGCTLFSSAAALTLGRLSVPVYEIYKVGEDPFWLDGLDLLESAGLPAIVIPHYDNAEGGHHDTRFCYLGERRLGPLETELRDDEFILGVDEHTGIFLNLDSGLAKVVGRGTVTLRRRGESRVIEAGTELAIEALVEEAFAKGATTPAATAPAIDEGTAADGGAGDDRADTLNNPLLESTAEQEQRFSNALGRRDVAEAVGAILDLTDEIHAWATDTNVGPEQERARNAVRSMIVRLGTLAETGARDPADVVGPFVELLLAQRVAARGDKRFDAADEIRDGLVAAGLEVHDTADGTTWELG